MTVKEVKEILKNISDNVIIKIGWEGIEHNVCKLSMKSIRDNETRGKRIVFVDEEYGEQYL